MKQIILLCLAAYSISSVYTLNRTAVCFKEEVAEQNYTIYNGACDFKILVQHSNVIVDKTLLIKGLLEHDAKIILITCPRKFGKSLNTNMIKTFLEIPTDKNVSLHNQTNYKLFKKGIVEMPDGRNVKLNKTFLIAKEEDIIEKYLGQYPVLHVKLIIVTISNYAEVFKEIIEQISEAFLEHNYIAKSLAKLMNDENRTAEERKEAEINHHMFTAMANKLCVNEEDIQKSLKFLCQMLYQYHGKRVFVLMDEYDNFLFTCLHSYFLKVEHLTKAADFCARLFDYTFLDNQYLEKGIITGILCLQDEKIFGNMKDIAIYDTINNQWSNFYGFNQNEANILFDHVNITSDILKKGRYWYHGYRMNKRSNLTVYNPWSFADFLEYQEVLNYWEILTDPEFFSYMFGDEQFKRMIESLVHEKQVSIPFQRIRFSTADLVQLKNVIMQRDKLKKIEQKSIDLILSYLCATGYLTYDGTVRNTTTGTSITLLRLPNEEVASEWRKRLIVHYQMVENISGSEMMSFSSELDLFIRNDTDKCAVLKNITEKLISDLPLFGVSEADRNKTMRTLIHYISFEMRIKYEYHTILGNETDKPDIILLKKGRGVFLKFKLDSNNATGIVDNLKQFGPIFYSHRHIASVKFIGIAITSLKRAIISSLVHKRQRFNKTTTNWPATDVSILMGEEISSRPTTSRIILLS